MPFNICDNRNDLILIKINCFYAKQEVFPSKTLWIEYHMDMHSIFH